MDNDEIRLSILSQYYRAKFNGTGYGQSEENPELKDISNNDINANLDYLVGKGLINGKKTYVSGGVIVSTSDITARGMDIVEMIIKQSIDKLEPPIIAEINKENTTPKRLEKLNEICQKYSAVFDVVIKVVGMVLEKLG